MHYGNVTIKGLNHSFIHLFIRYGDLYSTLLINLYASITLFLFSTSAEVPICRRWQVQSASLWWALWWGCQ